MTELKPYKILLLDIEGTVAPITFVKDVLFPYAAENVDKYLRSRLSSSEYDSQLAGILTKLIEASNADYANGESGIKEIPSDIENPVELLSNNIRKWIQKDKKLTPMKTLQGLIWNQGYQNGELKAPVYSDVANFMRSDKLSSVPIFIYSSGSVQAQILLFSYTTSGDLTKYISGYYDTNVGQKWESISYCAIAKDIGVESGDILFLTDIEREAFAAKNAGVQAILVIREGNAPLSEAAKSTFKCISTFDEIR